MNGGGDKALARHATAALLNASNPSVSYEYTVSQVVQMVQHAYSTGDFESVKNAFEQQNESGCDLGRAEAASPSTTTTTVKPKGKGKK
jgi:hypothetical protein